jgi:hypothetical protein
MGLGSQKNMTRFLLKHPDVVTSVKDKDVFLPVILAIGYGESGFNSPAARDKNNFFGIANGDATFDSPHSAFAYQADLFYKDPYLQHKVIYATSPYDQLRRIADSGYYSANIDYSLPKTQRPPYKRWTAKESADKYYNDIKGFIDDALTVVKHAKVTASNVSQILSEVNSSSKTNV